MSGTIGHYVTIIYSVWGVFLYPSLDPGGLVTHTEV